jgi:hypothetical protein
MPLGYTEGMRIVILLCAVALCTGLLAQAPGPILPGPARFPAALRLYLELTDTQVENIIFLNSEYQRWAQVRQRRMNQVRQELDEALAREPLDPMAIGLAMAEIEATQRQMRAELERTRAKIRAALNEGQTKRLKALEEILKLWPIYTEAVGVNLLEAAPWGVAPWVGGVIGVITEPGPRVTEP